MRKIYYLFFVFNFFLKSNFEDFIAEKDYEINEEIFFLNSFFCEYKILNKKDEIKKRGLFGL